MVLTESNKFDTKVETLTAAKERSIMSSSQYTVDGNTYSTYYDVTAGGDYTNDSFTKTVDGAIQKSTDVGNSGGYFTDYYGYYVDGGWYYSNYTNKTSSYNAAGDELTYSTTYYDSTVNGNFVDDFQSKTSGGEIYKQTDSGNYGDYYFAYAGTEDSTSTDKSSYYNSKGTETSQYTSYYASTASGDYTNDSYNKTSGGSIYKSTDSGNYGYYAYNYYGFEDLGWVSDTYTNKSQDINSAGTVTGYSTSYYDSTAYGNYVNDYSGSTYDGGIYKQTDTGSYGTYSLYTGTHDASLSDSSKYYNAKGDLTSETTSYYASTASGSYTSDTNSLTSQGDVYKSTDTGNYGYHYDDANYYGYYYGISGYYDYSNYYGWTADNYTDKSETYNSSGHETAYSTNYYNVSAYGDYTHDYFSKSSDGSIYKSTDTGQVGSFDYDSGYGFYYNDNYFYYQGSSLEKNSSINSSGALTNASTSYYSVTADGNWVNDYYSKDSAGNVYKSTDSGNYVNGSYTDTDQYYNSAGTRTGYSTTSGS